MHLHFKMLSKSSASPRAFRADYHAQVRRLLSAVAPSAILKRAGWYFLAGEPATLTFQLTTAAALRRKRKLARSYPQATKVDGIYDSDPKKNPRQNDSPNYLPRCSSGQLKVMDSTAFSLAWTTKMPSSFRSLPST